MAKENFTLIPFKKLHEQKLMWEDDGEIHVCSDRINVLVVDSAFIAENYEQLEIQTCYSLQGTWFLTTEDGCLLVEKQEYEWPIGHSCRTWTGTYYFPIPVRGPEVVMASSNGGQGYRKRTQSFETILKWVGPFVKKQ